jgi:hypothetical protein
MRKWKAIALAVVALASPLAHLGTADDWYEIGTLKLYLAPETSTSEVVDILKNNFADMMNRYHPQSKSSKKQLVKNFKLIAGKKSIQAMFTVIVDSKFVSNKDMVVTISKPTAYKCADGASGYRIEADLTGSDDAITEQAQGLVSIMCLYRRKSDNAFIINATSWLKKGSDFKSSDSDSQMFAKVLHGQNWQLLEALESTVKFNQKVKATQAADTASVAKNSTPTAE